MKLGMHDTAHDNYSLANFAGKDRRYIGIAGYYD